jgi:prepilin-type N-terminal cleavage/methylation domain-containing protein
MSSLRIIRRAQRGFAMLEVLLAVIVIAMVSFGVYQLYKSASGSSGAANFEQIVQEVMGAGSQYAETTFTQPTLEDLASGGYLPAKIISGSGSSAVILGPYGDVLFSAGTSSSPQSFISGSQNIPGGEVVAICNALGGSYGVYVGSVSGSTLSISGTDYSSDCASLTTSSGASISTSGTATLAFASQSTPASS